MTDSTPNNPGEGNSGTRIERILGEVLKQPTPEARERCLAEACGGDANLRAEIESLLAAHTEAGDFLERQREEAPAGRIVADDQADTSIERIGTMIGRYKLLEQIGEGGFGVVYMAEQVEPIQRKVALKIVKAGMDTREVIARFEAERQALALMDHPNIAHVLDAGATQAGRPYFVMELVKGIPITDFCDQKKLTPDERLDLFMTVCRAVQHAHQKGIIHRDIKPSNVLVTLHDGTPVPKVIDFGVAKALGQPLTEKTLFTGFTRMLGTPAYMSPEQAELSGLDVDTRSDIYSLGVLLYELLTGVTPLDRDTLARAALDEVRRMIQETEPQKPSTRVQALGDKVTEVATRRHTEPPRLVHFLRGDLDWIVMKCLEKDRRRRYDTPSGLVMDVQRHLTNEPVMARPPSQLYRLHKLIRRNKLVFAAGSAVAAALVLGLVVSTVAFVRAKAAHERAVDAEREQIHLRHQADRERSRAQDVAVQLGHKLWQVSEVLANLHLHNEAEEVIRDALEVFEKASDDFPDNRYFRQEQGSSRRLLGKTLSKLGRVDEAETHYRAAIEIYGALKLDEPTNWWYSGEQAYTVRSLAKMLEQAGRHDAAVAEYHRAIGLYEKASETFPNEYRLRFYLAGLLVWQGRLSEASILLREGAEHANADKLNEAAWVMATYADAIVRDGQLAVSFAEQAVALSDRTNAMYLDTLAAAYAETGEFGKAVRAQQEAIALLSEGREKEDYKSRLRLFEFNSPYREYWREANRLRYAGELVAVETLFRKDLAMRRMMYDPDDPNLAATLSTLVKVLLENSKPVEAEALARECLEIRENKLPDEWVTFNARSQLGGSLLSQQMYKEAELLLLSGYEGMKECQDKIPQSGKVRVKEALERLVQLYEETEQPDQAAPWKKELAELDQAGD